VDEAGSFHGSIRYVFCGRGRWICAGKEERGRRTTEWHYGDYQYV